MSNFLLSHSALSDAATLTSSTTAAGLGVTNLQDSQPGALARFTSPGTANIVADLTAAQTVNLIGLLYTNGTSSGTMRVRAATSEANLTAAPGYDSGVISLLPGSNLLDTNHFLLFLTTGETYQWWRLDIADATIPSGVLDAGRLYLANAWELSHNPQWGDYRFKFIDPSLVEQAVGGQLYTLERKRRRLSEFSVDLMSKDELFNNAYDFDRTRGRSADVLVIPDADDTDHIQREAVYGLFRELMPIVAGDFDRYQKRFAIEEMIP